MCPPADFTPIDIPFDSTCEELFMSLERMSRGCPLSGNVVTDGNPYQYMPSNLPDAIWYLIHVKRNEDTKIGIWKDKGETLEFEGQAPNEHKTNWMMREYWITKKDSGENIKAKGDSLLYRVSLGGERSPILEKQYKNIISSTSGDINPHSTQSNLPSSKIDARHCLTNKQEVNMDDGTRISAMRKKNLNQHVEALSEIDYVSRGDYLELLDLDTPTSPSSSPDSSSCLSMSSDECFDSLAFLQELEHENKQDLVQRDAESKFNIHASLKPNEVLMLPASSGSRNSIKESRSPTEETREVYSSSPVSDFGKRVLDIRSHKAYYRGEGPSSSATSRSQRAASDGKKKAFVSRIKKLKNKYQCFMPF